MRSKRKAIDKATLVVYIVASVIFVFLLVLISEQSEKGSLPERGCYYCDELGIEINFNDFTAYIISEDEQVPQLIQYDDTPGFWGGEIIFRSSHMEDSDVIFSGAYKNNSDIEIVVEENNTKKEYVFAFVSYYDKLSEDYTWYCEELNVGFDGNQYNKYEAFEIVNGEKQLIYNWHNDNHDLIFFRNEFCQENYIVSLSFWLDKSGNLIADDLNSDKVYIFEKSEIGL